MKMQRLFGLVLVLALLATLNKPVESSNENHVGPGQTCDTGYRCSGTRTTDTQDPTVPSGLTAASVATRSVFSSLPIIPGENVSLYGMDTPAGSGRHLGTPSTTIYEVTNLNDSGSGSLRYGLEQVDSPKTIVFNVSGTIELFSDIVIGGFTGNEAETKGSYITIAGQTAPPPGITIKRHGITIERNCHDVLMQHMRFRTGDQDITINYPTGWVLEDGTVYSHANSGYMAQLWYNGTLLTRNAGALATVGSNEWDSSGKPYTLYVNVGENPQDGVLTCTYTKSQTPDPITMSGSYSPEHSPPWYPADNIVFDHCSLAWGADILLQTGASNFTVMNTIIGEGLGHPLGSKGAHAKGMLVLGYHNGLGSAENIAVVQNLFINHNNRMPMISYGSAVVANNLVFDWDINGIGVDDHTDNSYPVKISIVGNYIIEAERNTAIILQIGRTGSKLFLGADNFAGGIVQTDPYNAPTYIRQCHTWSNCTDIPEEVKVSTAADAIWPTGYTTMSAVDARAYILANVGACRAFSDAVDIRLLSDVENEIARDVLECVACQNSDCFDLDVPFDCCTGDGEGTCPDRTWPILAENTRALDIPENPNEIQPSGYTKLEEWLHGYLAEVEIGGPDTTPPTRFNGQPTGALPSGVTSATLSLTTNETAACKYSTFAGVAYSSMSDTFTTTEGVSHSTTVSGLKDGASYTYYVRCADEADNVNTDDYPITFSVAEPLALHGAPADKAIRLSWTVTGTLPVTSTWQIDYQSQSGTLYTPITGIISPTRAYTLTGLTNYVWYTVTLNAMSGSASLLADTVRVMPTGIFVYLPLVLRGYSP